MSKLITYDWLVEQGACYYEDENNPTELGAWLKPKLPITIQQLKRMRKIPAEDKLWALYRLMSEDEARYCARMNALSVVGNWDCPTVVREWLETGDENLRLAARSAAGSAADSTARLAAWLAAYSAAGSAADSAASLAAYSAARSAADSVARSAAVKRAVEVIENGILEVPK